MTLHASPEIAAERRGIEKLAAAGDPLAIAQVKAWERSAAVEPTSGMGSIAGFIPKAAAMAVGALKRALPKLWAAESDRFDPRRQFDLQAWRLAWRSAVQRREETHVAGNVTLIYALAVIDVIHGLASTGKGVATETMERIGDVAGCHRDTVRRVVRDAELDGFLDTWNRTDRPTAGKLKGLVVRVANAYVPIMPEQDYADARAAARGSSEAVLPGDDVSRNQAWLGRVARQIKRGEQLFRLFGRKLGLNLTPMSAAPA